MSDPDEPKTGTPVARRSLHDLVFGLSAAILAVAAIVWIIPASVQVPSSVEAAPLSPAFLPNVLAGLIGVLGVVCLIQATLGQGVPKEDGELNFEAAQSWPLRLSLLLACFAALWLLPERVGMLPVAIVSMALLLYAGGERSPVRGVLIAVLLPVGVWLFFTRVAQVPLPEGVIEGLIPS